jgi:hypothetical protein
MSIQIQGNIVIDDSRNFTGNTANVQTVQVNGTNFINSTRAITSYATTSTSIGSVTGATGININLGNYFTATTAGVTTWTFANPIASSACGFVLKLTNGGSATQVWPSVKWPGGTAPTLTTSGIDVLTFLTDDSGTTWRGVATMLDSK